MAEPGLGSSAATGYLSTHTSQYSQSGVLIFYSDGRPGGEEEKSTFKQHTAPQSETNRIFQIEGFNDLPKNLPISPVTSAQNPVNRPRASSTPSARSKVSRPTSGQSVKTSKVNNTSLKKVITFRNKTLHHPK